MMAEWIMIAVAVVAFVVWGFVPRDMFPWTLPRPKRRCMCGTHTMGFRASTCDCPRCGPYNLDPEPIGGITTYQVKCAIDDYLAVEDRDADWFINRLEEYEQIHERDRTRYLVGLDRWAHREGGGTGRDATGDPATYARKYAASATVAQNWCSSGGNGSEYTLGAVPVVLAGKFVALESVYFEGMGMETELR